MNQIIFNFHLQPPPAQLISEKSLGTVHVLQKVERDEFFVCLFLNSDAKNDKAY